MENGGNASAAQPRAVSVASAVAGMRYRHSSGLKNERFGTASTPPPSASISGRKSFVLQTSRSGVPVEGVVTGHNKGGFEVRLGTVRAFCPVSQISTSEL